jgi:hypothetical protein
LQPVPNPNLPKDWYRCNSLQHDISQYLNHAKKRKEKILIHLNNLYVIITYFFLLVPEGLLRFCFSVLFWARVKGFAH